ncbi:MAG: hypothetical protein C4576_29180 [Desulfobacteraceae bacterium]|nr:MAG: hypothetical protein C4576_29180 [Desulfobacteraceae bacterium]
MARYAAPFAHGLMFHRFHNSGAIPSGQGSLTEVEFEKILSYVGLERILSPQEWLWRVKSQTLRDEDLCITFDDGLMSQLNVALPVLDKYRIKAFWFVFSSVFEGGIDKNEVYNRFATRFFAGFDEFYEVFARFHPVSEDVLSENGFGSFARSLRTQFPFYTESDIQFRFIRNKLLSRLGFEEIMDRMIEAKGLSVSQIAEDLWLCDQQLESLSRRDHVIGLHSYSHPFEMAKLKALEQKEQYTRNYEHIRRATGGLVESMSHPLNSYNEDTLAILTGMGIACGFRSNISQPVGRCINASSLELAREDGVNLLKMTSN